jgi:toxin YoeB
MRIIFTDNAWDDYTSWLKEDKRKLKKINEIIKNIKTNPFEGIGKPELLKYDLTGFWSRRIDSDHRIIYQVSGDDIKIYACKYHYDL